MNREEIIQRIRLLDPDQLHSLQLFLDQLESRPENQKHGKAQDPEVSEPEQ